MLTTFLGYDIFAPVIGVSEQMSSTNIITTIGNIHQARQFNTKRETDTTFSLVVFQENFLERQTLKDFFIGKKGKLTPFWYYNPIPIGKVLQAETSGTEVLVNFTSKLFKFASQDMFLYFPDSDFATRLTGVAPQYSDLYKNYEALTLRDTITTPINAEDQVYLLTFVRFDQDMLSIDYDNFKTSKSSIKLKELQADLQALNL